MSLEQQLLHFCEHRCARGERPVLGLNAPVGAGKTTFARLLQALAREQGLRLAVASIDDAYLPWQQRLAALAGNPFGVTRVPPGSHDPAALERPIRAWRQAAAPELQLPRFDKTLRQGQGDPGPGWSGAADALLLEGWLLGCRPLLREELRAGFSALQPSTKDPQLDQPWIARCNDALQAYQPLWTLVDRWVMFWPASWQSPLRWRLQAEAQQRRRGAGWLSPAALRSMVNGTLGSLPPMLYQWPLLERMDDVRILNGRRQVIWEGSGEAARHHLASAQS